MNTQNKANYLKEQMEMYLFLSLKEKEVNHDKYLYYLSKAKTYRELLDKLEKEEGSQDE